MLDNTVLPRLVFDTNMYISAALTPDSHIATWIKKSKNYRVFISLAILKELEGKLLDTFKFPRGQVAELIAGILQATDLVHPTLVLSSIVRDDDDHRILECAVKAKAVAIVTSDRGLLKLKEFEGIKIIHPSMLKHWFPVE